MNSNALPLPMPASSLDAEIPARLAADALAEPRQTRLLTVIEEALKVEKRTVDRGGWRVTKRTRSHEETVDGLLRDPTVSIERRPIGRTLDGAAMPTQRYEGDVPVLPVVREVLVTEKRLVLVEEIRDRPDRGASDLTRAVAGPRTGRRSDTDRARQCRVPIPLLTRSIR